MKAKTDKKEIVIIAHVKSEFPEKFGIPRQSGLVEEVRATVVFVPEYRTVDALRGLEEFSHIWLLWGFSEAVREAWSATVRPPKLGGNTRMGVFATRSPYRPNSIGLSSVKLDHIEWDTAEGPVVHVRGADLLNGTPIYDIKPYLPFTDSHPDAQAGFAEKAETSLCINIDSQWRNKITKEEQRVLRQLLAQDPRPAYQKDSERVYGMAYKDLEIKFCVAGSTLTVVELRRLENENKIGRKKGD